MMNAAVFTGRGQLVAGKRVVPFDVLVTQLSYARIICEADVEFDHRAFAVDMILMLPRSGLLPLPAHLLAPLVGCLDEGGLVGVQARDLEDIDAAAEQIISLVGGAGNA